MKIKKDWWKDFFDETYLITDARSVCDDALTRREADLLEKVLGLNKSDKILDLCGGHGRHSIELAGRGYGDLTVLDASRFLIGLGREIAKKRGLDIKFIYGDARSNSLSAKCYSALFIMANSFGYFRNDRENIKVLKEAYRVLRKGGRLMLDILSPDYVKKNLRPISWHEANGDILVCRQRELKGDVIEAREIVLSKKRGLIRDGYYCARLYDEARIKALLKKRGFKNISIKKNISLHKKTGRGDYGFLTSRMAVTCVKP